MANEAYPIPGVPFSSGEWCKRVFAKIAAAGSHDVLEKFMKKVAPLNAGVLATIKDLDAAKAYVAWLVQVLRVGAIRGVEIDWAIEYQARGELGGAKVEEEDPDLEEVSRFKKLTSPIIKLFTRKPISVKKAVEILVKHGTKRDDEDWKDAEVVHARIQGFLASAMSGSEWSVTYAGDDENAVTLEAA